MYALGVNILDVGGADACVIIRAAGRKQNIVRTPVKW